MPRKRLVPSDEVLHRATALFWRQGYEATSVDDLVQTTGANRAGLYGAFTGKRGLFLRALDHYRDGFVGRAIPGGGATGASPPPPPPPPARTASSAAPSPASRRPARPSRRSAPSSTRSSTRTSSAGC